MRSPFAIAACHLLLAPAVTRAQVIPSAIDNLFKQVQGVAIYGSWGSFRETAAITSRRPRAYGFELIIDLNPQGPTNKDWSFELGLGFDYLKGFGAKEPTLDLRGALRSLPTVSGYASAPAWHGLSLYGGVSTGFVQLWNARGYDPNGTPYPVGGETVQIGGSLGVYQQIGIFVEVSRHYREIRSLEWTLPAGTTALPPNWPRSLDLTGNFITVGYQFGRPSSNGERGSR